MDKKVINILIVLIFFCGCKQSRVSENIDIEKSASNQLDNKKEDARFLVDSLKIQEYLDSIRVVYNNNNWLDNYDFSSFVDRTKSDLRNVFGYEVNMYAAPTAESKVIKRLSFGDVIYIPKFQNGKITKALSYRAEICDLCFETYDFGITANGEFGFIHSNNFVKKTEKTPHSNYLLISNLKNTALIKNDYSFIKYINAKKINYSKDGDCFIYSSNNNSLINPQIYVYNLINETEINIGKGFTPIMIKNKIYYTYLPEEDHLNEKILCYDISLKKENEIFEIPDSLTIRYSSQDGGGVNSIQYTYVDNEYRLVLLLSDKDYIIESESKRYIINLNGDLIK